jgi:hypothetical protein
MTVSRIQPWKDDAMTITVSVVTDLSHHSRAQERSSSAKLNFRLSVARDVGCSRPNTVRRSPVLPATRSSQ